MLAKSSKIAVSRNEAPLCIMFSDPPELSPDIEAIRD